MPFDAAEIANIIRPHLPGKTKWCMECKRMVIDPAMHIASVIAAAELRQELEKNNG